MDPVRRAAHVTVGRAVGFACLAVVCTLVGLSFDPPLAAKTGGVLCLAVALVLLFAWYRAPDRDHRQTELWLVIEEDERPPQAIAQRVTAIALREVYLLFAQRTAGASVVFFCLAIVLGVALPPVSTRHGVASVSSTAAGAKPPLTAGWSP